jgi:hypothetical protein
MGKSGIGHAWVMCPTPEVIAAGWGMECHVSLSHVLRRQGGCCDLIDRMCRTIRGGGGILHWKDKC